MDRPRLPFLHTLSGWRRLSWAVGSACLPLLGSACAGPVASLAGTPPVLVRAAAEPEPQPVVQSLPKPESIPVAPRKAAETAAPHPVPISLDTVLRLAQDQNAKVNVAREQIQEAFAEKAVADRKWLPDLWIGTTYYRHEGGIENEDGTLTHSSFGTLFGGVEIDGRFDIRDFAYQKVNAERKLWQQRGELSRITSETLLSAAETYIDLLAAYQGEAIIRATDKDTQDLLKTTTTLAKTEPGFRVEVKRISAEIAGREQGVLKLRSQAAAARAKLAYLLGVGPDCDLVPVDNRLGALSLVDATPPACDLVAQALTNGPGIREMEGLLNLIQESLEKAKGPSRFIPVVGFRMAEGAFGTGPGDSSDWDNRWDLCLHVRWNLTELATARDRLRAAQAKLNQVHLTYQDLRAKLTAGVQEARESVHSGHSQLRQSEDQISNTAETLRLSRQRLEDLPLERKSPSEVLLAIRSQMGAQLNYLSILRDYDKAQLRLLVLLGQATPPRKPPVPSLNPWSSSSHAPRGNAAPTLRVASDRHARPDPSRSVTQSVRRPVPTQSVGTRADQGGDQGTAPPSSFPSLDANPICGINDALCVSSSESSPVPFADAN